MSDFNTEKEEVNNFSGNEEFGELYLEDRETDGSWLDPTDRDRAIDESTIALVQELVAIRTSLNDRQRLTETFDSLSYNVVEQRQQLQSIILSLEQLTKSISADNLSRFLQIQKSFSTFSHKLETFDKTIEANIRRQQESQKKADEVYQNLGRSWRRIEDEVKVQRQIVGRIQSWENFAILVIGTGFSAAAFMLIGFKLFMAK